MDGGIDLNELPGARGRAQAGNAGLVKPRDVLHARAHRPEIRQIPHLPEAWNRPPRASSFVRKTVEYLGTALQFLLLLTLGVVAVATILVGGYFIVEAVVSWTVNAAAALLDWILSGVQSLARSAVELVVGLVVGAIQFVIDAIVWVVVSAVEAVVDTVLFLIDAFIEFWVGLFTFIVDSVVALLEGIASLVIDVLQFIFDLLITLLIGLAFGLLLVYLSPIWVPLALLYYLYISIF